MGRRPVPSYAQGVYSPRLILARLLGIAILLAAGPVGAQDRGPIGLGAFIGYTSFAAPYAMKSAVSYGARIGATVVPRVGIELEANVGTASRPNGLGDRPFRFLDARVLVVPVRVDRMSVLLGAGGGRLDADIDGSALDQRYLVHALVGGRVTLGGNAALRLDYTRYFAGAVRHGSLKAGLCFTRHPAVSRRRGHPFGAIS